MSDIKKSESNGEHKSNIDHVSDNNKEERHGGFVPPTPEEEAKVIRKFDWHLMPVLFVLYMLAVLDRGNIGNARIAGMEVSATPGVIMI